VAGWKQALEASNVGAANYPYAELIEGDKQPRISGLFGDITEILVSREGVNRYSLLVTVLVEDLDNANAEQISARLREFGADPDDGWE